MSTSPLRWRAAIAAAVVAALAWGPTGSNADELDPPGQRDWPGLPVREQLPGTRGLEMWGTSAQAGVAYTAQARQWIRLPETKLAISNAAISTARPRDRPELQNLWQQFGKAVAVPDDPALGYGTFNPGTIRTVAFGSVPVEARLVIRQVEDENGVPKPIVVEQTSEKVLRSSIPEVGYAERLLDPVFDEAKISAHLTELKVDGVDVGLHGDCRTASPATLRLTGQGFRIALLDDDGQQYEEYDPRVHVNVFGNDGSGTVFGTFDLPRFTECTTRSGDDLSALITSAVSGPDNQLRVGLASYGGMSRDPWPTGCQPVNWFIECYAERPTTPQEIPARP